MTKGTAVILGPVGNNFGAGMTGGVAFIYDPDSKLKPLCNLQTIEINGIDDSDAAILLELISEFQIKTASQLAGNLLEDWPQRVCQFRKVAPKSDELPSVGPASTRMTAAK